MFGRRSAATAAAVVSGFAVLFAAGAPRAEATSAPTGKKQMTELERCLNDVRDAEEARQGNPVIGDKAAKTFEQLIADASRQCENREFAEASQTVNTAKGMVASE